MKELLAKLKISSKITLVDNGLNDYFSKSYFERLYGLTDMAGRWVVPAIFSSIEQSEDMFIASTMSKAGKQIYFIDKFGRIAFKNDKLNIINARGFKYGCSLIEVANIYDQNGKSLPWTYTTNSCKWGLIDKKGNILCAAKFNYETDVNLINMKQICDLVIENGAGALEYVNSKLFANKQCTEIFKSATKLHILKKYKRDKEDLKQIVDRENTLYKSIKVKKLAENILAIRQDKSNYAYEENCYIVA